MSASPAKRRVLAPLDANAPSPNSKAVQHSKGMGLGVGAGLKNNSSLSSPLKPTLTVGASVPAGGRQEQQQQQQQQQENRGVAQKLSPGSRKRFLPPSEQEETAPGQRQEQPAKRQCRGQEAADAIPPPEGEKSEEKEPEAEEESEEEEGQRMAGVEEVHSPNADNTRQRSTSPDASSVFDASGIDTSQATALTEPDQEAGIPVVAPLPPRPRRAPTREESRQKAEILRLRLGLAKYKVRTGQTDVVFDKLQMRPCPGMTARTFGVGVSRGPGPHQQQRAFQARNQPQTQITRPGIRLQPPSRNGQPAEARSVHDDADESVDGDDDDHEDDENGDNDLPRSQGPHQQSPEKNLLPRMPPASAVFTPQRRHMQAESSPERLTSSALRGGAAKGLLSLSRG